MRKLLTILLFTFIITVFATANRVEISFCVGDETLTINGEALTVEKPYIHDEGTTLVPVRVITESFGAKVGWDGNEKKVTLEYGENTINLWIGKDIANVNGDEIALPAPCSISGVGTTMVPLRFISENFGAVVGYDNATKKITVSKAKDGYIMYSNEKISLDIPENYTKIVENDGAFSFSKECFDSEGFEVKYYNAGAEDINYFDTFLKNDRTNQDKALKNGYKCTLLNNITIYDTTLYYYKIIDEERNVYGYKAAYLHNETVTMVVALKTDLDLEITMPKLFESSAPALNVPIFSKKAPFVCVELFTKDSADSLLEKEATLDNYKNYENLSVFEGYVICELRGCYAKITSNALNSEDLVYIAGTLTLSNDEQNKAKNYLETTYAASLIEAESLEFILPEEFEIYMSSDKSQVFGYDKTSGISLVYLDYIAKIDNDSRDINIIGGTPSSPIFGSSSSTRVSDNIGETAVVYLNEFDWEQFEVVTMREYYRTGAVDHILVGREIDEEKEIYHRVCYVRTPIYEKKDEFDIDDKVRIEGFRLNAFIFIVPDSDAEYKIGIENLEKLGSIINNIVEKANGES